MKYRISFIHNDEYSHLKPSDPESRYSVDIEADSKAEAILKYVKGKDLSYNRKHYSACPVVWEVTETQNNRATY